MSTPDIVPYLPDFKPQIMSYVLHNATPDEVILKWGGLQMTVPPVDRVGPRPAFFEKKEGESGEPQPIPGTRIISDTYTAIPGDQNVPGKGDPPNWIAASAIRNILKIDPETGEALGASARRGISVLPASPSTEMIEEAKRAGRARYEQFLVEWATDTVNAYQGARDRNQQAGYAPPPPGSDYQRAVIILEKSHAKMRDELGVAQPVQEDDDDMEAFVVAEAMKMAQTAAKAAEVDPAELAGKLLENPQVRSKLKNRYRIRKVGHLPDGDLPEGA